MSRAPQQTVHCSARGLLPERSRAVSAPGFIPYSGEGFALLLPARWNPSKEKDFPGTQQRKALLPRCQCGQQCGQRPGWRCSAWLGAGCAAGSVAAPARTRRAQRARARRYEDNGDAVNNLTVYVQKTDKSSIEQYGGPDKFLGDVSFLLGQQVFKGARRRLSAAHRAAAWAHGARVCWLTTCTGVSLLFEGLLLGCQ